MIMVRYRWSTDESRAWAPTPLKTETFPTKKAALSWMKLMTKHRHDEAHIIVVDAVGVDVPEKYKAGGSTSFEKKFEKALAATKELHFAGYDFTSGPGGTRIERQKVNLNAKGDYGADPIGDGNFRMVPSGDIVDFK
jgi:hypothetical protein